MNPKKRLVACIALFEMFAITIMMANTWFLAMRNGGAVVFRINLFNEMHIEYFMWLILTPILVLGLYYNIEALAE